MASPFWGLYEDLPPPVVPSSATPSGASAAPVPKPDLSEWTSNPKLAKMMPTAIRKKAGAAPMVPRSVANTTPSKVPKSSPKPSPSSSSFSSPAPSEDTHKPPQTNALSLVSAAYASDMHAMEVEEEYDPARPNEYDKYVDDRIRKIKMEKEEEARREREREREEHSQWDKEEAKPMVDLNMSGEDAFARRARMSGRAPSPPRVSLVDDDIDGEAIDYPPPQPQQPPSSPKESVAARMMARMGWREGAGLGKEEQGMTTALVHKRTADRKTAIIVNAPPVAPSKPARAPLRIPPLSEQTKVLLLKNMVGPGEVDDDLESETAQECGKYGEVSKCLIYEVVGGVVGPTEAVRIFLQFARQEAALKAFIDLNGRFFGGRAVNASFFNEDRFMANDLAPNKEEMEQIKQT